MRGSGEAAWAPPGMIRASRWRGAPPRRATLGWARRCDRDGPRQIRAPRVQVHHGLHAGASHCELGPAHERSGCDEGSAPRRAADAPAAIAVSSRTISLPFHAEWRRGQGDILCNGRGAAWRRGGQVGGVSSVGWSVTRRVAWAWAYLRRVHRRLARAGLPPSGLCLFIAAVWGDCNESGFGERGCVEVASVRRRWECVFARRCASCRGRASPSVRVTASCGGRERRRVRLWWGAAPALVHFLRVAWCAMVWGVEASE